MPAGVDRSGSTPRPRRPPATLGLNGAFHARASLTAPFRRADRRVGGEGIGDRIADGLPLWVVAERRDGRLGFELAAEAGQEFEVAAGGADRHEDAAEVAGRLGGLQDLHGGVVNDARFAEE